jgi:hypothetical protein
MSRLTRFDAGDSGYRLEPARAATLTANRREVGSVNRVRKVSTTPRQPSKYSELTRLLAGDREPSIRLWIVTRVLDRGERSPEVTRLRRMVRTSPRVEALLAERRADGTLPYHPYISKWYGPHWVLAALADLGYPPGDRSLIPLRDQVLAWLFSEDYRRFGGMVKGHVRMHASIDAGAVHSLLVLGLDDSRVDDLVERIVAAQWPDGGWNCDRDATGRVSSFHESLIPMRALALYARLKGDGVARAAMKRASELFLTRQLFRRRHGGRIIHPSFVKLHYPPYWHYDILFALTVMSEAGFIGDRRCAPALDLLESKRLEDGGFPAEARYYKPTREMVPMHSLVDWGGTSVRRMNPWVSARALGALHAAGRA